MVDIVGTVIIGIVVLTVIFFTSDGHLWVSSLIEGRRQFKLEQLRIKHYTAPETIHSDQDRPFPPKP